MSCGERADSPDLHTCQMTVLCTSDASSLMMQLQESLVSADTRTSVTAHLGCSDRVNEEQCTPLFTAFLTDAGACFHEVLVLRHFCLFEMRE